MSNEKRRKLLKSIAAGSGAIVVGKNLPESWSKPVVNSVMLPAHAQTSDYSYSLQQALTSVPSESLFASLVADAHAGGGMYTPAFADYCVDLFGQMWRAGIWLTTSESCPVAVWWAEGTVGGGAVTMSNNFCGGFMHPPVTFRVISRDASAVQVEILEDGSPNPVTSIPIGTCTQGDPTAVECCQIAGTYCGQIGSLSREIQLDVGADGSVSINIDGATSASANVNPYCGGSFDVTSVDTRFDVTGTVVCGQTSITGTVVRNSDSAVFNFTATVGGLCPGA